MAEVLTHYSLEGNYVLNGNQGTQKGDVYYLSNSLLVGFVRDDNTFSENWGQPKLLLGIHDCENDELGILKIAPGFGLKPVSWWLSADFPSYEKLLRDSYQGYYLFHEGISLAYQVGEMIEHVMPSLEELVNVPIELLTTLYFTQHNIETIKKQKSATFPQEGTMRFIKQ